MVHYHVIREMVDLRHQKNISQINLSKLTGIKQPIISRLENGTTVPKIDTLIKILDAMDYELRIIPKRKIT